ncbi:GntR family transcriptional regulator [Fervidibacillus halotolerans]|uniref:GntR family transcriptional regulator n=1 Tax=Fervidibacillus halotolerans TaxID=2980027 RepID=A0A9E8M0U7_9BACI|nr:GntR family transcriptional regulator [Fervidibacillus halotolerans]WAA13101.1 GntR family transcriptional regulator [Fervidibacillus halotolerans]
MEDIIKKIENKFYKEHDQLPSERDLCSMYGTSRITVRQALQELEREGYIYKIQGKGTYVASKSYNQKLIKLYSFTDEMKKLGKNPSTKVLSFTIMSVDEYLAEKMNLLPKEEVFKIVRLRLADGEPMMYETTILPKKWFPHLTATDLVQRPMYDIFLHDYQVKVTRAIEQFSATTVRQEEAEYLNCRTNQPALFLKRFAYSNRELIEYTKSVVRGDKFVYTVELT